MKIQKQSILLIFLLVFASSFFIILRNIKLAPTEQNGAITTIVNLALEKALVDGEIIDGDYPNRSLPVVISSENIEGVRISEKDGWRILILDFDEILMEYTIGSRSLLGVNSQYMKITKIRFNDPGNVDIVIGLMHLYGADDDIDYEMNWGLFVHCKLEGDVWRVSRSEVMVI